MNFIKVTKVDSLLESVNNNSPKVIAAQLIDYVMSLRNDGIAYATIQYLMAPIFTFYQLNDVVLNRKKVQRYLGEYRRVVKDKAYTTEQIQQALQNADQRMRMIILPLASTGCRIGALPSLTLGNLTKMPDYDLYKITIYEGTNNEYYTFCTREAAQTGIDPYLLYRQMCPPPVQNYAQILRKKVETSLAVERNDSTPANDSTKGAEIFAQNRNGGDSGDSEVIFSTNGEGELTK